MSSVVPYRSEHMIYHIVGSRLACHLVVVFPSTMRNDDRHPQRDVGSPDDTANDAEIARLLAEFDISDSGLLTPPPTAPQHPSRIPRRPSSSAPPPYSVGDAPHLSEYPRNYAAIGPAPVTPTRSSTYSFRTPCMRGVTQDW
jgi:hypothetical protein